MIMMMVVMVMIVVVGMMFMMVVKVMIVIMIMIFRKRCYWEQRGSGHCANQSKLVKHLRSSIWPMSRSMRRGRQIGGANKTAAVQSEPPLLLDLSLAHMPLVHFLAVASHCMPAFLQAASVFGAPAKAGALKATTRLKARIETSAFI
jgi:Flp pilus assembly protein TadB